MMEPSESEDPKPVLPSETKEPEEKPELPKEPDTSSEEETSEKELIKQAKVKQAGQDLGMI